MRFLIDNALSPRFSESLRKAGHDTLRVRDIGMAAASDREIFDKAASENRVIVSADTDFGTLLALRQEVSPSVLLFRGATPRKPADQAALLLANLVSIEADLNAGEVVVLEPTRIHVRELPIVK